MNANTYVLYKDGLSEAIVIDPTDADRLDDFLTRHSLRPAAVLLTHGHFDHICGLPELLRKWKPPVYLHSGDGLMLTDPMKCGLHLFFPKAPFEPVKSYEAISDGQEICVADFVIRVLSTPGHSKGSVCYLISGVLFAGDTLFRAGFGRTDLWGGSYSELTASLGRLGKLPADTVVYPGHGDTTTIGAELL
ncbi:MAG: MBL fold metallo-hydrolase [Clostridia bacterium]|nr:MBL fold metallo-hydrolase [Clostridia bacterium]